MVTIKRWPVLTAAVSASLVSFAWAAITVVQGGPECELTGYVDAVSGQIELLDCDVGTGCQDECKFSRGNTGHYVSWGCNCDANGPSACCQLYYVEQSTGEQGFCFEGDCGGPDCQVGNTCSLLTDPVGDEDFVYADCTLEQFPL